MGLLDHTNQWAGGSGDGSAASAMNSTTSSNGIIIVDSDLFGADANYDANWVENCWFSNSNILLTVQITNTSASLSRHDTVAGIMVVLTTVKNVLSKSSRDGSKLACY